jgi:hypothetical protein
MDVPETFDEENVEADESAEPLRPNKDINLE